MNKIGGIIFSKDRAMQLDALLQSFFLHCRDTDSIDLAVLYTTSEAGYELQYQELIKVYSRVRFVNQNDFRKQLLEMMGPYEFILFLVDDSVFVRDFSIESCKEQLARNNDAIGFSLRLGCNTVYCYMFDTKQQVPEYTCLSKDIILYDWTKAEVDFGYPLELSSSLYRNEDIFPLLRQLYFNNPNVLESILNAVKVMFKSKKPQLICFKESIAFSIPSNRVQNVHDNRSGKQQEMTAQYLNDMFRKGYRIDVEKLNGYIPNSCHEEVEFVFIYPNKKEKVESKKTEPEDNSFMYYLKQKGLAEPGKPLRLHMGCGEYLLDGYVNIDFPPGQHSIMKVKADAYADITKILLPKNSVDEIRSHHVFEHFDRVTAIALLIKWQDCLKVGGRLVIETPDIIASAKTLVSDATYEVKMGVVRHLAGDQADNWAYHLDHWFPERFNETLEGIGFKVLNLKTASWEQEPYLSNVTAVAEKAREIPLMDNYYNAVKILRLSIVSKAEKETFHAWQRKLQKLLLQPEDEKIPEEVRPEQQNNIKASTIFKNSDTSIPLADIHRFNQQMRDKWVREKAQSIDQGAKVLDVGAGTCPYKPYFQHCNYLSQDFMEYKGIKLGGGYEYGRIDIVSTIEAIPVEDNSFDVVLCTEVLEHVPEPIAALREMSRILKPGGRLLITAPLSSGLHQLPYHFYGGFTPEWYKYYFEKLGLGIVEIRPNGGFLKHLSQECERAASYLAEKHAGELTKEIHNLLNETLPRWLYQLDEKYYYEEFTVGFHVEGVKKKD